MISSKYANSYSDKVAKKILKTKKKIKVYKFQKCGADERQYNFPGVNLPVVTICRSKFGEFKQYHTSKDNLNFILSDILHSQKIYRIIIIFTIELYFNNFSSKFVIF